MLKLYVEEAGRELVREVLGASDAAATSTIAYAEARAGLARRFREEDFIEEEYQSVLANLDGDWITYERLDVSGQVSYFAGELAERHALRGYDAVHLASAMRFSERFEELRFLAFDDRLNEAAGNAGLAVYGDGSGSVNGGTLSDEA